MVGRCIFLLKSSLFRGHVSFQGCIYWKNTILQMAVMILPTSPFMSMCQLQIHHPFYHLSVGSTISLGPPECPFCCLILCSQSWSHSLSKLYRSKFKRSQVWTCETIRANDGCPPSTDKLAEADPNSTSNCPITSHTLVCHFTLFFHAQSEPIGSMYGIFAYIYHKNVYKSTKCR